MDPGREARLQPCRACVERHAAVATARGCVRSTDTLRFGTTSLSRTARLSARIRTPANATKSERDDSCACPAPVVFAVNSVGNDAPGPSFNGFRWRR